VDTYTNPRQYISNNYVRYGLWLPALVDERAALLPLDDTIQHAFDPYAFVRDAYLARRAYQITGKSPDEQLIDPGADTSLGPDGPPIATPPKVAPPPPGTPPTSARPPDQTDSPPPN
jgi:hypothetical protein